MTVLINDGFTNVAGTDITAHTAGGNGWAYHSASATPQAIIDGDGASVRCGPDQLLSFIISTVDPGDIEYDIEFVLKPKGNFDTIPWSGGGASGEFVGILTNYDLSVRTGYECFYNCVAGEHAWVLQSFSNGTLVDSLQSVPMTLVAGHVYAMRLEVRETGHRLVLSDNGGGEVEIFDDADVTMIGNTRVGMFFAFSGSDTDALNMDSYSLESLTEDGTITASVLSKSNISKKEIALQFTAASGGVDTLETHLYRGENRVGALLTDLGDVSGQTSFVDKTARPNRSYTYQLSTTDGATTATSNRIFTSRTYGGDSINLGWIGDSNYVVGVSGRTTNIAAETALELEIVNGGYGAGRNVTLFNQSVGGKGIRDFQSGQTIFDDAVDAFVTANVNVVVISHGYNDSYYLDDKATFKANMANAIESLFENVATLKTVVMLSPVYLWIDASSAGTGLSNDPDERNPLSVQYNEAMAELHNGTMILFAGTDAYTFTAQHPEWFAVDSKVHLNDTGCQSVGKLDAESIGNVLFGALDAGGGISGVALRQGSIAILSDGRSIPLI